MTGLDNIGKPLLLLALIAAGAGLTWHIGHNLLPGKPADALEVSAPEALAPPDRPSGEPPPDLPSGAQQEAAVPNSVEPAADRGESSGPAETRQPEVRLENRSGPAAENSAEPPAVPDPAVVRERRSGGASPLVVREKGRFLATQPILFNSGYASLRPASTPILDELAALLKQDSGIRVEIVGYTDNLGPEAANLKVSSERAAAVRDYLVARGIDRSRLESKGMGSRNPIASNGTQLGRQANRRIEFLIISPE